MIVLSKEQKRIINKANDYNLIVDCVVGSGKTTTILEIAKDQSIKNPDTKILLLLYNNKLKKETIERSVSMNLNNIDIHTFHSYCYHNVVDIKPINDYDLLQIIKKVRSNEHEHKNENEHENEHKVFKENTNYDIIIIDEAQDLNQLYYEILCLIIKNNKKCRICVFGDKNQSIYKYNDSDQRYIEYADILFNFNNIQWIKETLSETFRLNKNIKNFVNFCKNNFNIISNKHSDNLPRYIICNQWGNRPYEEIKYYLQNGYVYSDILVLGPSIKVFKKIINKLSKELIPIHCSDSNGNNTNYYQNKILFCTFHQAKGIERKVTIVFNFDYSYFKYYNKSVDPNECPNEIYVGITRSTEQLSLIHDCKSNFMPFLLKRSFNYLKIVLPKLCHVELPQSPKNKITIESINNILYNTMVEEKTISISVSEILKHLSVNTIEKLLTYIDIKKINTSFDTETIKINKTTIGSHAYEFVADITGTAIPMYFEYKYFGTSTISNVVSQKIYSSYNLPTIPVSGFIQNPYSMNDEEKQEVLNSFVLTDEDEILINDTNKNNKNNKDINKDTNKDNNNNEINNETILKIATKWSAISSESKFKLNQISKYNWISQEIFDKCADRIYDNIKFIHDISISNKILFETFHKKNSPELINTNDGSFYVDLYGYIDCSIDNTIWEFKCTEITDPIYFIQLALYLFLSDTTKGYLLNILSNELYEISISSSDARLLLYNLFKAKYINKNISEISDITFINKNKLILEYYNE